METETLTPIQGIKTFHVHQQVTLVVNRYEIYADDGTGDPAALVAFAEQKRAALREQLTLFTDTNKTEIVARFRASKIIDLNAPYHVTGPGDKPIGTFRKDFRRSLTRSTWLLTQPGHDDITIAERTLTSAILRRAWSQLPYLDELPAPIKYHFDFQRNGEHVGSFDRKTLWRDRYLLELDDPTIDRRLALALAVALDALQGR